MLPFLTQTARIREETLESGSYLSGCRNSDSIPFKLMPPWKFSADIVMKQSFKRKVGMESSGHCLLSEAEMSLSLSECRLGLHYQGKTDVTRAQFVVKLGIRSALYVCKSREGSMKTGKTRKENPGEVRGGG